MTKTGFLAGYLVLLAGLLMPTSGYSQTCQSGTGGTSAACSGSPGSQPADWSCSGGAPCSGNHYCCFADACNQAVMNSGGVFVNDIFHDKNGHTAYDLVTGTLMSGGSICNGHIPNPQADPGQGNVFICDNSDNTLTTLQKYADAVDWLYINPTRINASGMGVSDGECNFFN